MTQTNELHIPDTDPGDSARNLLPPLSATKVATALTLSDSCAILLAGYVTYDSVIVYSLAQSVYLAAVAFIWLTTLSLLNFGSLYRYEAASHPFRHVHRILIATATAFLFLLAAAFSIKVTETISRLWLGYFAIGGFASLVLFRLAISYALVSLLHVSGSKRSVAIIGAASQSSRLLSALAEDPDRPLRIHGVFDDTLASVPRLVAGKEMTLPAPQSFEQLISQVRSGLVDDVVIAIPWHEDDRIMAVVAKLRELPVHTYLLSDLVGFRTKFRSPPSHYGALPILEVAGKPMSGWDAVIKAVEDCTLAPIVFTVTLPLLALIAVLVKLDSPGPVLFRQKRLGFNNKIFDVYKFRTMRHEVTPASEATQQATPDDARVTRLGRVLRRWSLDELPQIFNVLNGTMSLVGPRPHALDHNEQFAKRAAGYFGRHRVKPGITGLAQVRGFRGGTETAEKLEGRIRNDIYYAENWSLFLDIRILLRTVVICIAGNNAY